MPSRMFWYNAANGFLELPLGQMIRVACLLSVRMLVDGIALLVAGVMKLVKAAERV